MHIAPSILSAVIVGIMSAIGAFLASRVGSRATQRSAEIAFIGVSRQIDFQHAAKMAEFRQAWINDLRNSMASLQSYGVTPENDHERERKFYMFGTKIELLMNRDDPNYTRLQTCMYKFFEARTREEKFTCNAPFVAVCQDILKTEWEVLKKELRTADRARTLPSTQKV